jgi:hypothetical protein
MGCKATEKERKTTSRQALGLHPLSYLLDIGGLSQRISGGSRKLICEFHL